MLVNEVNKKTLYVGFDLGDGETLISFAEYDNNDGKNFIKLKKVRMPGENNAGTAIPTAYGIDKEGSILLGKSISEIEDLSMVYSNFKKQPSTLLNMLDVSSYEDVYAPFLDLRNKEWPEELSTPKLNEMKDHIITFTNALFESEIIQDALNIESEDKDKIVFAIGHPTKWKNIELNPYGKLDIAIYKKIFMQTIIGKDYFNFSNGKSLSIAKPIFDSESRAAFLNAKESYFSQTGTDGAYFDKGRVVIDVGSSTVDITAYPKKGKQFNTGHAFLGARILDYLILEDFFEKKKSNSNEFALLNDLLNSNKDLFMQLLLACRKAKENCYSNKSKSYIEFKDFDEKINYQLLETIENKSIANILRKYLKLPEDLIQSVGNNSWKDEFRSFLLINKHKLLVELEVEQIILTGSASKMSFIKDITREVFNTISEGNILVDVDPASCVSDGLAMMGASREKSEDFRNRCDAFLKNKVPEIILENYKAFAEKLGKIVYNVAVESIILKTCIDWRDAPGWSSKKELSELLYNRTSEEYFKTLLLKNYDYSNALNDFSSKINDTLNKNLNILFNNNTDYSSQTIMITDINGKLPNLDMKDVGIDLANIIGMISTTIVKCLFDGLIIVAAIALASQALVATPIIAVGGGELLKQAKNWAENIGGFFEDVFHEIDQYIPQGKLGKKIYIKQISSRLEKNNEKNIQGIVDELLKDEKKRSIVCSINRTILPVLEDAQKRIEYLIEDNN